MPPAGGAARCPMASSSKTGGIRTVSASSGVRSAEQHPDRLGLAIAPDEQQRATAAARSGIHSVERSVVSRSAVDDFPRCHIAERTCGSRGRPPTECQRKDADGLDRPDPGGLHPGQPPLRASPFAGLDGDGRVVRLPDPAPDVPDPLPGQWWPPVMLQTGWVAEHHGTSISPICISGSTPPRPPSSRSWTAELAARGRPLVMTVHDLTNPHFVDQARHRDISTC